MGTTLSSRPHCRPLMIRNAKSKSRPSETAFATSFSHQVSTRSASRKSNMARHRTASPSALHEPICSRLASIQARSNPLAILKSCRACIVKARVVCCAERRPHLLHAPRYSPLHGTSHRATRPCLPSHPMAFSALLTATPFFRRKPACKVSCLC